MNDRSSDLSKEIKSLEAELAALVPSGTALSSDTQQRDELMYRAGWEACAAGAGCASATSAHSVGAVSGTLTRSAMSRIGTWLWPLSTAGLLLVAATLAVLLAMRDEPHVRIGYVKTPTDTAIEQPRTSVAVQTTQQNAAASERAVARDRSPGVRRFGDDYLSLRERVLAFGVDVLPSSAPAESPLGNESGHDMRYGAMIGRLIGS